MLGLLLLLTSLADTPTTTGTPALIASLPAAYVGTATEPGACRGPQSSDGFGVTGMTATPSSVIVRLLEDPGAGRIGGCTNDGPSPVVHRLSLPDLRPLKDPAPPGDIIALPDLVAHRCVNRKTLRPYTSLVLLGAPLDGYAIEVSPSRNITTLRLIDARTSPAKVEVLGKVGVRTLEWCDRTDVAEGHCPNPAQGEIRQVVLAGDQLVLTMALGFADVCGQDDLMVKAFPLPTAVRRALRP